MATSELKRPRSISLEQIGDQEIPAAKATLSWILTALASLKLTVALFAASIFLVYMGTLAQKDHDVWVVVNHTHFRTWIAWIDWVAFERLVQIFFKDVHWNLTGSFPFPGGNFIGSLLLVNLIAAHSVRFKIAATGNRLAVGLATIAIGVLVTWLAIHSGMNKGIESELSPAFCDTLWQCVRGTLVAIAFAGAYFVYLLRGNIRKDASGAHPILNLTQSLHEWRLLVGIELALSSLVVWLLIHPSARLDDAGLRILWQLIKGSAAGLALLVGCVLVFRKRAGIVLLHAGVGVLMLGELFTGVTAEESQMRIPIGSTANWSEDYRSTELSVIDRSAKESDHVTVVPASLLAANVREKGPIDDSHLPFRIRVNQWLQNSELKDAANSDANSATEGFGKGNVASELPPATGMGKRATPDIPSAYVELISKSTGKPIGTFLASAHFIKEQPVTIDGKQYDIALRFKRVYYPYTLTLKDFTFKRYVGTNTAKDYRSTIVLRDPRHNIEREVPIWMNNPLRYDETTFYQSDFDHVTEQATILSAVNNPSWMTPYVACMLVAIGMLTHFGIMLVRFLKKRADEARIAARGESQDFETNGAAQNSHSRRGRDFQSNQFRSTWMTPAALVPALVLAFAVVLVIGQARMPESQPGEMKIYDFAKLPLAYQGRIKPYDTLALNTLQLISGRQELVIIGKDGKKKYQPAIVWLLDVISGSDQAKDYQVFRVENLDLLDALGLEHRPQHWRYSLRELQKKPGELHRQIKMASAVDDDQRTLFQKKVIELARRQRQYMQVRFAFETSPVPKDLQELIDVTSDGTLEEKKKMVERLQSPQVPKDLKSLVDLVYDASDEEKAEVIKKVESTPGLAEKFSAAISERLRAADEERSRGLREAIVRMLREDEAPCAVPPTEATVDWKPLYEAENSGRAADGQKLAVNPAARVLRKLLDAYAAGNVAEFNQLLDVYRGMMGSYEASLAGKATEIKAAKSEILSQPKIDFEVFYNKFSPFYFAAILYFCAFVLGTFSWIGWSEPLRRASIWLIAGTLVLHTFALVARMYISGRPPITNLYSTAIFIGWGGVILAMLFELIYRLGLGNIVASTIGFLTLLVAHFLSLDGDTFIVLQAVLDTQFWLATHVVSINMGYAATYTVGLWGAIYILFAHVFPVLDQQKRHKLLRMLYGTLCFAIFFSFVGTVLGGLWGDDSWGRFWGWDPKENGALMIVLWNALVLHARWGGMVKGRGLATLAVVGNIVTTWSYFGVNMLGEGLHAYGGSDRSTAMWLLGFAASQLALAGLGMMPPRWFESMRLSRAEA
jgi:ABC-type transport system involved in cytochrome c biogenesis permease subunit